MRIAIDARMLNEDSGIERILRHLLEELEQLDPRNEYLVLLRKANFDSYQPTAKNFRKVLADFKYFSLGEQLGFCWFLYRLRADLVHFPNINHPVLYFKHRIVTVMDLTLL